MIWKSIQSSNLKPGRCLIEKGDYFPSLLYVSVYILFFNRKVVLILLMKMVKNMK